jgi:hypothetical protein
VSAARLVVNGGTVLRGASHLYRSWDAAKRASATATTSPAVVAYDTSTGDTLYAGAGDCWIGPNGERGQYLYGRRGRLLEVTEMGYDGREYPE